MNDRCLFMTGASSDVGMELLESIGEEYSLIYAHFRNENPRFLALKERFKDRLLPLQADFEKDNASEGILEKVREKGVWPDHFVHLVSGKMEGNKFHKRDTTDFDRSFRLSVIPAVSLLKEMIPKMAKKRYGRIVFMLSSAVLGIPPKYQSPYVTSKFALLGLMKALSSEYAGKGITVNGVSPDMMDTKFLDGTLKKEVVLKENAEINPLNRNIRTEDVIPLIRYLLSDGSEAVTGQNISVTGGVR